MQISNVASGFIQLSNGQIYYSTQGLGEEVIVWVHGLPLNSSSWHAQLCHFNQNFLNICLDLRGYGQSSALPDTNSSITDLYCDDLLLLFDTLKLRQVTLVGFASAGHIAMRFAANNPNLISKLVIINGSPKFLADKSWPYGFEEQDLKDAISAIDAAKTTEDLAQLILDPALGEACALQIRQIRAWFTGMLAQARKDTLKAFFSNIAYDDDRELIGNITAPTLIISSKLGKEVPSATALFIRNAIENSQLFEINGIDHFAFATQASLINAVIDQFMSPRCQCLLPNTTNKES
tara:strand:- start:9312 stop:10190 length:879 start_codon:yes stop_codon:yes gene_type:complete